MKKSTFLILRLADTEKKALAQQAQQAGQTMSGIIRQMIDNLTSNSNKA
jgi:hypothetical protein